MFASKTRSILKTLSWRIVGTLDTMALGWLITGDCLVGLKIGALELFTKMILYYFHERIWFNSKIKNHRINSLVQKKDQLKKLKIDFLIILNFNKNFAHYLLKSLLIK